MSGSGMNMGDLMGLQTINGLVSGCIGLLRDKNNARYRISEMEYQAGLNMENMSKGKELDFLYQQQLQSGRFKHELEAMRLGKDLDFQNGVRMQMLSHTLRVKEAENMFEQQLALKDRDDNKYVWPLQTAIGQADLFRKDCLTSSLPINIFVVANDEYKSTDVEQEINRNLESFFAYRGFGLSSSNAVFGRFGSWKSAKFSKLENINLLWSVMKGVPVMVIRPEFRKFGKELEYRILFWGNSMNQDGYTQEKIFTNPYDISDDTKKELLVEEVSPMISCFAGVFCDCYHLIERGAMPQMPFAMNSVYGTMPQAVEERVIDIYKSALYAITQTNYLGDYTPVAYLNVIKSLMAIGMEKSKAVGRQLTLESMAVWENQVSAVDIPPVIPSSFEVGAERMLNVARKYGGGNREYVLGLQSLFKDFGLLDIAGRIKALESMTSSGNSSSQKRATPKTPSNKLVEMVKVDGGSFKMGGTGYDIHTVGLDTFYIGKYPVTQREWKALMGNIPSWFKGDDCPVERVSWYDAVNFCNKLSKLEDYEECYRIKGYDVTLIANAVGYRLPTEAEWEYAARGGNKSRGYIYAGSNNLDDVGWYDGNLGSRTHSVNQKSSNELGLYDMSGNVWEWCWDWYDSSYYACSPNMNPTGPASGSYRVCRGGAWGSSARVFEVSFRMDYAPGTSNSDLGFRLAFSCSSK